QGGVELSGADLVGKVLAVFQEQRFNQSFQSKIAADEKAIFGLTPAGDPARFGENRLIEEQQNGKPEDFDEHLQQEIGTEGELAQERKMGEREPEAGVTKKTDHVSAPIRTVPAQADAEQ